MLRVDIPKYHKARRDRLMAAHPNSIFILPGSREILRNPDVPFPFRQESNFYYLTGLEEAEAFLILASDDTGKYKSVLFVQDRDKTKEVWTGELYGVDRAKKLFDVDEAFSIKQLDAKMPLFLDSASSVYYRMGFDRLYDQKVLAALETCRQQTGRSGKGLTPVLDPKEILGEYRVIKSKEELELMRKATRGSALAHVEVIRSVKPGMNESEVEALIDFQFRKNGCRRNAYSSIVAGGKNATCLHYVANNEELKDGDVLLIDAGGEHGYYAADITRTFPVGKKFTPEQAKIYDLVLKAQKEGIAMCKPGVSQNDVHERVCEIFEKELKQMGILKDPEDLKRYYIHSTGHYLGMDVHDVGLYSLTKSKKRDRPSEPGMIFTIEPGLYFQPDDTEAPEELRGIGIRIEDDILITDSGHEVLTSDVPKERDEIEKLRA